MDVTQAVTSRRSIRHFLDKPVDPAVLKQVLETARRSPSGGNTQPWNAIVLTGQPLADFTAEMKRRVAAAPKGGETEYDIYPKGLEGRHERERVGVGESMYGALEIAREDKAARIGQMMRNFDSFGAPVQLFTYTRKYMGPPQWSDMGMWLQTIMLLLREAGLDSCPQEIWAQWGLDVKELLGIDDAHIFFCGMAIGHRDPEHAVNRFDVSRASLDETVEWRGFGG